jgi:hypothetical protein
MNKSLIGILLGAGLIIAGVFLMRRRPTQSTQAGAFGTTGLAPAPSRFSLGGQRAVPQTQARGAPASWATIAGEGINALGRLASIYIERRASQPGVTSIGGGRSVATDRTATADIGPGIPISLESGVVSYDIGDPDIFGGPAVGGVVDDWA